MMRCTADPTRPQKGCRARNGRAPHHAAAQTNRIWQKHAWIRAILLADPTVYSKMMDAQRLTLNNREARQKTDPQTPDPYRACSKRAFEGEVRVQSRRGDTPAYTTGEKVAAAPARVGPTRGGL